MAFQKPEGVAAVYDHFIVMARKARIKGLETAQEGNTSTAPCDARHGRREEGDTKYIGPGVNRHDLSLDMDAVNKGRAAILALGEHHAQDGREGAGRFPGYTAADDGNSFLPLEQKEIG